MIYDIYAVGNTLRSIRNKYGYTQNDMAESLDVSDYKVGDKILL